MMPTGKKKLLALLVAILIVTTIINGQELKSFRFSFYKNLPDTTFSSDGQSITFNYILPELNIEEHIVSEGVFYTINAPGHTITPDAGKPGLPVLSRLITIPSNSTCNIKITAVKSKIIKPSDYGFSGILFPVQIAGTKGSETQQQGFIIDNSLYGQKGTILSDTVVIDQVGKVRNNQLATFAVYPVRYNPFKNEIEVITSMNIEVTFELDEKRTKSEPSLKSELIDQLLLKSTLNYDPAEVINGFSEQPVGMIILTDTTFRKFIQPLIKWKNQKGYKVDVLYRGIKYAGTTYEEIKTSISNIYNNATPESPAPEYLLIIGDINKIPKSGVTSNLTDMYYGEFDGGGDFIPEMLIGRLPVSDTSEVKAVINKIIQYEKFEYADTNTFYKKALVTAGNDELYKPYMNAQVRYAVSTYLNPLNKITNYNFSYPKSASAEDSIKKLINKGLGFINFSGHGDASGWVSPAVNITDIASFTNKNMYPFIISNACRTAQFNVFPNFGSRLVTSNENGAIGFIGCTNDSYWDEDYYWIVGFGNPRTDTTYASTGSGAYDGLFHTHNESPSDWYISMGQINFAGNLGVSASTSNRKKYYWETYNLLGDPSVIPIMGEPSTFNISIPDTLPNGIQSLSWIIHPHAYIAISDFTNLWDASFASSSGSVTLAIPEGVHDSCLVVVTGQNKIPVIKTVYFDEVYEEFLNLESFQVNDIKGNNNSVADYSETFNLKMTISNLGLSDSHMLHAKLYSDSEWITILTDSMQIGTLNGKSQIVISDFFSINVKDSIPDNGRVNFLLLLKSEEQEKVFSLDITIHAPIINLLNYTINDALTGNNNKLADPGETVTLIFKVQNSGSSSTSGLFKILNQPVGTVIPAKIISTGDISPGAIKEIPVTVTLSELILPGSLLEFKTMIDCNPYISNKSYVLSTGMTRESFEYQNFTIFPWVNNTDNPWIITNTQAFDGLYSARSGIISHLKESVLKINVNIPVPDTLKFRIKVSSELNYDFLALKINGVQAFSLSGESDSIEKKIPLPVGVNFIEFIYKKDESVSSGSDCAWIDFLTFPRMAFSKRDLSLLYISNPMPNKEYHFEYIKANASNVGIEVLNGFNLAYKINDNLPVNEFFDIDLNPGDTAHIQFSKKVDLSFNGTYLISVYGVGNNDNNTLNDTTRVSIIKTAVESIPETLDNGIKVIPNPFTDNLKISVYSSQIEELQVSIYGITGRLLIKKKAPVLQGENIIVIGTPELTSGVYILRITGNDVNESLRVVKTE